MVVYLKVLRSTGRNLVLCVGLYFVWMVLMWVLRGINTKILFWFNLSIWPGCAVAIVVLLLSGVWRKPHQIYAGFHVVIWIVFLRLGNLFAPERILVDGGALLFFPPLMASFLLLLFLQPALRQIMLLQRSFDAGGMTISTPPLPKHAVEDLESNQHKENSTQPEAIYDEGVRSDPSPALVECEHLSIQYRLRRSSTGKGDEERS